MILVKGVVIDLLLPNTVLTLLVYLALKKILRFRRFTHFCKILFVIFSQKQHYFVYKTLIKFVFSPYYEKYLKMCHPLLSYLMILVKGVVIDLLLPNTVLTLLVYLA
jgi:hypothetical protein